MELEYQLVKTIETPNYIARVFSPILDETERTRRYEAIKRAAEALLKAK